jgi:hypothetical protein
MTEISFPPLHDLSPGELETRKQHLLSEITRDPETTRLSHPTVTFSRRRWLLGTGFPTASKRQMAVLAGAVVCAALAASLIGVFAFGKSNGESMQPGLNERLGTVGRFGDRVTLPPPPRSIAITDLSLAVGAPVALPVTSLAQPTDAHSATAERICPVVSVTGIDGTCFVVVRFPSQSLTVEYDRPTGQPGPAGFAADVQTMRKEATRHPGSGRADLLDLNGVPAMFMTGDYSFGGQGTASIHFIVGETAVTISGHHNEATLQALAQSILDTMPAPRQVVTADASSALGAPVVLPETSLVQPSDVAQTSALACPSQPTTETPCQVTVTFPSLTIHYVPLTIRYLRPASADPNTAYASVVKQIKGSKIISVGGVPALFVPGPAGSYPSWIEFVSNGTDITVQGNYNEATLQAVAQSIIDRSGSQ